MLRSIKTLVAAALVAGCASYPVPVQRLADAQSAERAAREKGAAAVPRAKLHCKLAQEEIARAKRLLKDGKNEEADYALMRAEADGELALQEAKEHGARVEAQKALEAVAALRGGAPPTSVTTTTSATVKKTPTTTTTTTTTTTQENKP
jgi:hypothetical protein